MTSLEDLLWLYKMALQFNLEAEKQWLKQEIEERMASQESVADGDEELAA